MDKTNISRYSEENQKTFQRYFNRALICQAENNLPLSIKLYEKALTFQPLHLATLQVLAQLQFRQGQFAKALQYYTRAVEQHEHSATLHNGMGMCYEKLQFFSEAKTHFEKALELRQDFAEALSNYGNLCRKLGLYETAEMNLLKSLRLTISANTLCHLGILMAETGNFSQAHSFFDHALRLQPDNVQIQWHKGLLYLKEGDLENGWLLFDNGLLADTRPKQISPRLLANDTYSLDFFRDKSVYLTSELNLAEEIMFSSCYNEIIEIASRCVVECDDRLVSLFSRAFPNAVIKPKSDHLFFINGKETDRFDTVVSSGSVPRFTRRSFRYFPGKVPYLFAKPELAGKFKSNYEFPERKFCVGVACQNSLAERQANYPGIKEFWRQLSQFEECKFITLPHNTFSDEFATFQTSDEIIQNTNHLLNFEQLAAQMAPLNLVITSNNIIAHLAGAMGLNVWVLLPFSANWYWFNGKQPCPWYPQVKIIRQKTPGDWQSVINKVMQMLESEVEQQNTEACAV